MTLNCLMGLRNQSNEFMKKINSGEIVCVEEDNVEDEDF